MLTFMGPNEGLGGGSLITYQDTEFSIFNRTVKEIVKLLCAVYGSTYEGRKENICNYLNIVQKPPIMVSYRILLFPIETHQREYCWINYFSVVSVKREKGNKTRIVFLNQKELIIHTEYRSIVRQMKRCRSYLDYLNDIDDRTFLQSLCK